MFEKHINLMLKERRLGLRKLYAIIMYILPGEFRKSYGKVIMEDSLELFKETLSTNGIFQALRVLLAVIVDTIKVGISARMKDMKEEIISFMKPIASNQLIASEAKITRHPAIVVIGIITNLIIWLMPIGDTGAAIKTILSLAHLNPDMLVVLIVAIIITLIILMPIGDTGAAIKTILSLAHLNSSIFFMENGIRNTTSGLTTLKSADLIIEEPVNDEIDYLGDSIDQTVLTTYIPRITTNDAYKNIMKTHGSRSRGIQVYRNGKEKYNRKPKIHPIDRSTQPMRHSTMSQEPLTNTNL